jgi:hypothetical protein
VSTTRISERGDFVDVDGELDHEMQNAECRMQAKENWNSEF